MGKVFLVIQREYLAKVKKKSFLLATLLTPLIFPTIMGVFLWMALEDKSGSQVKIIEVVDENDFFYVQNNDAYVFSISKISKEEGKEKVQLGERYGFLYIPKMDLGNPSGIQYYGGTNPSMTLITSLEASIKKRIEDYKLMQQGIDPSILASIKTSVSIQTLTVQGMGQEAATDATLNYGLGFLTGILIYIFIFVYGNQVMQGVIEEKSSRIIEILVSSLRPFQLMLGKIIGIGAVGLTQFLIWIFLISALSAVVMGYFGMQMPQQTAMVLMSPDVVAMPNLGGFSQVALALQGVNFIQLVLTFVFYFLGGFLLYGAFFAAIGAAVDTPSDAQQFMFPVTIPLLIAYMGLFIFVLDDPDSIVSFWLSVIPLTSPIAMMGRISFGVPIHELLLSMGSLIVGFLSTTWLAGKIYRIGILMHGSKVGYKTLWKWIRSSS
ncbi:ABC transporter permease [Belliella kenyensis]|uniref:ABC transporter permease n=1 Tax=Belliella kenyensis TaxID=1472724 RepID=A0ABV8ES25_9BACT|nr:ABC transporter permease [Belliella kenyensis]MCH7402797.1 ABC transporter permease [Belliella kenyensis]MDN3602503.1 ABC transporter permease [Belliella kenyensis]